MTTSEALRHPFITGAAFFPRYPSLQSIQEAKDSGENPSPFTLEKASVILECLVAFQKADPLAKLMMEMVSHTLGAVEV